VIRPGRIFETVLYAEDLAAAERFYHATMGLEIIERSNVFAAFRCGGGVLLVFDPRKSAASGRDVPAHGTSGAGHVAFAGRERVLRHGRKVRNYGTKSGESFARNVNVGPRPSVVKLPCLFGTL